MRVVVDDNVDRLQVYNGDIKPSSTNCPNLFLKRKTPIKSIVTIASIATIATIASIETIASIATIEYRKQKISVSKCSCA